MVYAYKTNEWEISNDNLEGLDITKRVPLSVIIGVNKENGEETPIIEEIYSDILTGAIDRVYKTTVQIGMFPPVVFTLKGELIKHNDKFDEYKAEVIEAAKNIQIGIITQAIAETSNAALTGGSRKNATAIASVLQLVRTFTHKNYNIEFIMPILKELVKERSEETKDLSDKLEPMTKQELTELLAGLKEYNLSGQTSCKALYELLNDNDIDTVKSVVYDEVCDRVLFGLI